MTTFTTEDRLAVQIEMMQKISNEHYQEMKQVFTRKALTDEEIDVIGFNLNYPFSIRKIARAIEISHGIIQEDSEQTTESSREIPTYQGTEEKDPS